MWQTFREWAAMKSADAWGDESEWRIVCPIGSRRSNEFVKHELVDGSDRYFLPIWTAEETQNERTESAGAVKQVFLGTNAHAIRDSVLQTVTESHLKHVQVWETKPCTKKFALKLSRIR